MTFAARPSIVHHVLADDGRGELADAMVSDTEMECGSFGDGTGSSTAGQRDDGGRDRSQS
ncbi:hypothetical protein [Acrocarpospora sp. B8E8]|uniref:hypothetical protein n=1 Tax=Acrocarpospora sp. B8E8 TaxID=3153572 RepID=UPI00325E389B